MMRDESFRFSINWFVCCVDVLCIGGRELSLIWWEMFVFRYRKNYKNIYGTDKVVAQMGDCFLWHTSWWIKLFFFFLYNCEINLSYLIILNAWHQVEVYYNNLLSNSDTNINQYHLKMSLFSQNYSKNSSIFWFISEALKFYYNSHNIYLQKKGTPWYLRCF